MEVRKFQVAHLTSWILLTFLAPLFLSGCVFVEMARWAMADSIKPFRACQVFGHWQRADKKVEFHLYPNSKVLLSFETPKGSREFSEGSWSFDSSSISCTFPRPKEYEGNEPGGLFFGNELYRGDPDTAPGEPNEYYIQQTPFSGKVESLDKLDQTQTYTKYCFIDTSGKVVAPGPFQTTSLFHNGFARVTWEIPKELEKFVDGHCKEIGAFIDRDGLYYPLLSEKSYKSKGGFVNVQAARFFTEPNILEALYPFTYGNEKRQVIKLDRAVYSFSEPVAMKQSRFNTSDKEHLFGFLGTEANIAIPPKYKYASSFTNGAAAVSEGGKYYYIDNAGKKLFNREYDFASDYSEGLAAVFQNGAWGYIGDEGSFKIQPEYEWAGKFKEGVAPVKLKDKYGIIDKKGKFVIRPSYLGALSCGSNLIPVIGENGNWGYVSKSNEIKIPFVFPSAEPFSEDRAAVAISKRDQLKTNPDVRASQLILLARETKSSKNCKILLERAISLSTDKKIKIQARDLKEIKGLESAGFEETQEFDLGVKLLNENNYADAAKKFERLISDYPKFVKPYYGLALILYHQKKYRESEAAIRAAIKQNRKYARAYWILGKCLNDQGKKAEAVDCINVGLAIDPLDKHLWKLRFSIN